MPNQKFLCETEAVTRAMSLKNFLSNNDYDSLLRRNSSLVIIPVCVI